MRRPYFGACSPGDESHSFKREAVTAWRAFLIPASRNEPGGSSFASPLRRMASSVRRSGNGELGWLRWVRGMVLSETGGSTTLSVTDGSRRRGGDVTSRFSLCPVANLRNFNAPNLSETDWDTARSLGQSRVKHGRPAPAETGHSPDQSRPLMQTAPPSRIMLGGAVLNPDSAIPRQLSVCRGAIRFNGQRQLRRRRSLGASAPVPPCAEASAAHSGMPRWQDLLFIRLSRSANDATDYFQIPTGRVVEVGTQVTVQGA